MMKNSIQTTIQTKHQCITAMITYEGKSVEELRWQDYLAIRKGPQQISALLGQRSTVSGGLFDRNKPTSLFGGILNRDATCTSTSSAITTSAGGLFGPKRQTSLFSSTPSCLFGGMPTPTSRSGFLFGGQQPQQAGVLFGAKKTSVGPATTSTGLSFSATLDGPLFGAKPTVTSAPSFGVFDNESSARSSTTPQLCSATSTALDEKRCKICLNEMGIDTETFLPGPSRGNHVLEHFQAKYDIEVEKITSLYKENRVKFYKLFNICFPDENEGVKAKKAKIEPQITFPQLATPVALSQEHKVLQLSSTARKILEQLCPESTVLVERKKCSDEMHRSTAIHKQVDSIEPVSSLFSSERVPKSEFVVSQSFESSNQTEPVFPFSNPRRLVDSSFSNPSVNKSNESVVCDDNSKEIQSRESSEPASSLAKISDTVVGPNTRTCGIAVIKQSKWNCDECFVENTAAASICVCCSSRKGGNKGQETITISDIISQQSKEIEKPWICTRCFISNSPEKQSCTRCSGTKPGNSFKPAQFGFSSSQPSTTTSVPLLAPVLPLFGVSKTEKTTKILSSCSDVKTTTTTTVSSSLFGTNTTTVCSSGTPFQFGVTSTTSEDKPSDIQTISTLKSDDGKIDKPLNIPNAAPISAFGSQTNRPTSNASIAPINSGTVNNFSLPSTTGIFQFGQPSTTGSAVSNAPTAHPPLSFNFGKASTTNSTSNNDLFKFGGNNSSTVSSTGSATNMFSVGTSGPPRKIAMARRRGSRR